MGNINEFDLDEAQKVAVGILETIEVESLVIRDSLRLKLNSPFMNGAARPLPGGGDPA